MARSMKGDTRRSDKGDRRNNAPRNSAPVKPGRPVPVAWYQNEGDTE